MEKRGEKILDTEAKLRERVKELSCLYEVARIADRPGALLEEVLRDIVELLPPAWQFPEITFGRITLDGRTYETDGFVETPYKQSAAIVVNGKQRGLIEVVYRDRRPPSYEGPFLREERNLIDALAREVSGVVSRHQARQETAFLEDQLRHADRLATIGQLAAGVAHELNEPLSNILGFAQLAQKTEVLPESTRNDLKKIVTACLYAREIVSKLRIFARQTPAEIKETNLNDVVQEGLFFIESRCSKKGIALVRDLDPHMPKIKADPNQLLQVLTNLTVNAVQAMQDGGRLIVRTYAREHEVALIVEDTGGGMSPEIQTKIFLPFFTTKDVDKGTGLGLSVVHGIVAAHGGVIEVDSQVAVGSKFEVRLPINENKKINCE
jgi:two-component system NtrC family sensor kinase